MTDILDAEELDEALKMFDRPAYIIPSDMRPIFAAARAHLATLPRWKEIEVETWRVYDKSGQWRGYETSKSEAQEIAGLHPGWQAVRLTGTAKVRA